MNRRVWTAVLVTVLAMAVAVGIGVTAYQVGLDQNVAVEVAETTGDGTVVVTGPGWNRGFFPFFPFGFLFPILFILLIFGLFRAMWWRGPRWGGGPPPSGHEPWEGHLEAWHREAHARSGGSTGQNP